jgi:ubiquitin C-terminal hydrolase
MRGARGGGGDRKPQAKRPNAPSQLLPGRAQLEIMLADAHYELEQDPYRGLRLAAETNGNTTGPWQACCWGILPSDEYDEYDFDASEGATLHQLTSSPEATVQYLCHCSCPSLTAWTRQHQSSLKSRAKKRKSASNERGLDKKLAALAVGQRQDDPAKSKFYMCDYNPFCLASLGGVMDDILQERSEEVQQQIRSTLQLEDENNTDDEAEESTTDNKEMSNKRPKVINLTNEDDDGARSAVSAMDDTVAADSKKNNMSGDSNMEFTGDESKEWDKTAKPGLHVNDLTANDGSKKEASRTSSASQAIHVPPPTPFDDSKIASSRGAVAKVFTRELKAREGEDHPFKIEYSKFTRESLNELRKGQGLDVEPIQKYLSLRMEGRGGELTPRTFLEQLRRWHKSILFTNPNLRQEKQNMSDRILLSLPPGISNLGATCYLNTQLQCLAQNTTFLEGIFSWKHQDGEDGMNSVMSSLQELLAQMLLGGNNKLTTSNFSKALGLDLDEQQDPNEFARLLFDRMDESFNKCGDPQLSNLLQKIFRGVVTYETTCKTCRSVSAREEAFMDLNLPIVQPENDDTSNATPLKGQTTLEQAFASNKNVDTDVQYCLETYLSPEKLDGDNQYFCGACDCKRDAERVLKVTSLPPVLNVQLSRYVFDRKKFTKKKLSDKVLLPSALQLCEKQFLLCAVMRHQGKSAYSGHYVAEAMDWTTGLWFEFNDEKVKLLEAGPSCSYDPKNGVPKRGSSGSTDAYNMYYVEKSYLNERSLSSIIRRGGFVDDLENSSKGSDSSILVQESNARKMRYSLVSE